jgi:hypothetical protein
MNKKITTISIDSDELEILKQFCRLQRISFSGFVIKSAFEKMREGLR